MSEEENTTPVTVELDLGDFKEEVKKSIDKKFDELKEVLVDKEKTVGKPEPAEEEPEDYRIKLAEMVRKGKRVSSDPNDKSFIGLKEAFGKVSAGSAIPELWAADVIRCCPYPASAFWKSPFVTWHQDVYGKPGKTINVVQVGKATCISPLCVEGTTTAAAVTSEAIDIIERKCAHYICKTDMEDVVPDTVTALNETLAACIDHCIDNIFLGKLSACAAGTLTISGPATGSAIARLIGSMRAGTCEPIAFIGHPVVEAQLMMDTQFTNAATFGNRSVITGGHIYEYLGLDFVFLPKGTLEYGAANSGTWRSYLIAKDALHGAYKRDIELETDYDVRDQRQYFIASVRFGALCKCEHGVWLLLSTT